MNEASDREPITSAKNVLKNFLLEHTNYQNNNTKESLAVLNEITENDEIWLVQCPKRLNPNQLIGQHIRMPGKSHSGLLETLTEEFTSENEICLGFKNGNEYEIKQFQVKGSCVIRERLKSVKAEEITNNNINEESKRVPFPSNLKIRHPLHGFQFEEKIQLKEDVVKRLMKANESNKKKRKEKNYERDSAKKVKKSKKNISVKLEKEEEVSMDLAWIKNI